MYLLPKNITRPSIKSTQTYLYDQTSESSPITQYSKGNVRISHLENLIFECQTLQGKGQTLQMEKQQAGSTSSNVEGDTEASEEYLEQGSAEGMEDGDGDHDIEQDHEEEEDEENESISLEILPVQFQKVGRLGYCHCWCYF